MIGAILTIVAVPILFGIRIALQDFLRGIGSDRRYRKARERAYEAQLGYQRKRWWEAR